MDYMKIAEEATNKQVLNLLEAADSLKFMHSFKSRINPYITKGAALVIYFEHCDKCHNEGVEISTANKYNMIAEFREQIKYMRL